MTTSGSSAARFGTKSTTSSRVELTRSTICVAASRMCGSIPLITFGVNPRATRFRSRVCWGGSWLSIISSVPSPWSSSSAPPCADENVFASRSMPMTSWYFVTTQKPGGCVSLSCQ